MICITETWLTPAVSDPALHLKNYKLYRKDRTPDRNGNTKHGGVLIGVRTELPSVEVPLHISEDVIVVKLFCNSSTNLLVCCLYSAPHQSLYTWDSQRFIELIKILNTLQDEHNCKLTIICGDINFCDTDWSSLHSCNNKENEVLETLVEFNYEQVLDANLDVFLCNDLSHIVSSKIDDHMNRAYSINKKRLSNHSAYACTLAIPLKSQDSFNTRPSNPAFPSFQSLAYGKADWPAISRYIENNPFCCYCYTNVTLLIAKWYQWIFSILSMFTPRRNNHRTGLPPWISPETSHLMKKK